MNIILFLFLNLYFYKMNERPNTDEQQQKQLTTVNCSTYSDIFVYWLKVMQMIKNIYNIKPLENKDGTFSFRRKDVYSDNEFLYAFAKAAKNTNIRTHEQLNHMAIKLNKELFKTHINLSAVLSEARNEKQPNKISQKKLEIYEKTLGYYLSNKINRINVIKNYGLRVLKLEYNTYQDYYFERVDCGYISLYAGILLVDNINLNMLYRLNNRRIKTNEYGVYIIDKYMSKNVRYVITFDIAYRNADVAIWKGRNHDVKRLYIDDKHFITVRETQQNLIQTPKFKSTLSN